MRLLIVRIGAMGDVLHAMPAVAALRQALPGTHIGWAIEPRWRPLLECSDGDLPLVDTVHDVQTRLWKTAPFSRATLNSIAALRGSLRSANYDLCVDMQGSIRSAFVGRLAGVARFIGQAQPREAPARLLYSHAFSTPGTHVIEQGLSLLSAAVATPLPTVAAPLPIDTAAETWVDALLQPFAGAPPVLLVPQAGWGAKQWPAERYGALALALTHAGFRVLMNQAGPADTLAHAAVLHSGETARPADTTLPQLIALLRRTALVVAGDTGPLHLAAALRRPVVALFGPTDPARNGPFRTPARVLRHPSSLTDHRRHRAPERGLLQITSDDVLRAALDLLDGTAAAPQEPL